MGLAFGVTMQTGMNPEPSLDAISGLRSDDGFASARTVLSDAIASHAFPGCAYGVLHQGKVVLEEAQGRFSYESESRAVAPGTIYDIASLTKVVATTAMAMILFQRGQLDLELPLGELLPGFVVGRDAREPARQVRLRHLLAHNSGLPGYVEFFRTVASPAGLLRGCLQLPIKSEPGTQVEYSDPGFILLGKALEVLAHEGVVPWTLREIFRPLEMNATGFCPAIAHQSSIPPTEIDRTFRNRRIQGEVQDENAWLLKGAAGHAGLFSNVPDLLRFAKAILPGKPDLFAPDTVERFARRQEPEGSSRALGWDTPSTESSAGQYFSPQSIGHLGYSGCSLWIDREAEVAVVLLTNRTWPDRKSQLIRDVRPAFHDAVRRALSALPD